MIARFTAADLAMTSSFSLDYGRVAAHNTADLDLICLVRRHDNFYIYCTVASTSFRAAVFAYFRVCFLRKGCEYSQTRVWL